MGERTGSLAFYWVWSYVADLPSNLPHVPDLVMRLREAGFVNRRRTFTASVRDPSADSIPRVKIEVLKQWQVFNDRECTAAATSRRLVSFQKPASDCPSRVVITGLVSVRDSASTSRPF